MDEGGGVEIIDFLPRAGDERDHGAVTSGSGLLIEGLANPEREFEGAAGLVSARVRSPTSRDLIPLRVARDAALQTERGERRIVETSGSAQVIGAETDVSEHGVFSVTRNPRGKSAQTPGSPLHRLQRGRAANAQGPRRARR